MQKAMSAVTGLWNRGCLGKVVIVIAVLFIIGICAAPFRGTQQQASAPVATQATGAVSLPTAMPEPTGLTEAPTAMPEPTAMPDPTVEPVPTAEPPTQPPAMARIGDKAEANGMALTVVKVEKADAVGQFLKAQAGNTYVIAEVIIENVSADKSPYNPFYFKVKDADGFEYNVGLNTDGQALKSGELSKGEKARGTVLFEVKKESKGMVLEYRPIVFGSIDPIRVALD